LPRRRRSPYTKGEKNKVVDALVHPWIKQYPFLRFVDGALHALVEENSQESLEKFIRYHGPDLLEDLARWLREQK
jgi:hypothetical protein